MCQAFPELKGKAIDWDLRKGRRFWGFKDRGKDGNFALAYLALYHNSPNRPVSTLEQREKRWRVKLQCDGLAASTHLTSRSRI